MEMNREVLFQKWCALEKEKAKVTIWDLPFILFLGGDVKLEDGKSVSLVNAFAGAFLPDHMKSAQLKCGHTPATRLALNSDKLRHQLISAFDDEVDDATDPYGYMLETLETQNREAIKKLVSKGYNLATKMMQKVARVTNSKSQARAVSTVSFLAGADPKRLLGVKTTSKWFQMTCVGIHELQCHNCCPQVGVS